LVTLLRERGVREAGIRDVFDLAEALLAADAVQATLERLARPMLAVLAAARTTAAPPLDAAALAARTALTTDETARSTARLTALALLAETDGGYATLAPVSEALEAWPSRGLPSPEELIDAPPPPDA